MKIILASNSPRRKELLAMHNIDFEVCKSNIKEEIDGKISVIENVCNLAKMKCLDVFQNNSDKVVLAADTIVVFNNKIYGKPVNEKDAYKTLEELSGNTHEVITAVAVASPKGLDISYCVSKVHFKNISKDEILEYIATKEPMDKAGSYAIQGIGSRFVLSYTGEFDNIVGLPMKLVLKLLKKHEKNPS